MATGEEGAELEEQHKIMTLTWPGREGGGGKLFVYHLESSPLVQSSARVAVG